ncbi:SDR family NAD(P)-dependent oxidoreductase [Mesorhizobium sp. SP-1A]|uniref:SDR family NAD(P)-dependent oxidoreductase n=1 Tax=Mesorhizobium sp. SP-1A TaxID=3077840 RepID=UPI0028F703BE|nr:SDR family NAD(P)-dependent oxidoreductase [Mesorhizobium sp. SP-1A]
MGKRLQDRVAVVIGAAQGIGEGIAERFAQEGAFVIIGDMNPEKGQALADRLGPSRARFCRADISREEDVEALFAFAVKEAGRVDILAQNAGIYPLAMIEDTSRERWERVFSVNMTGTFMAARACIPLMRARNYGRLVFTSSITGVRVVNPGHSAYAATKSAINGFIKAAAVELAGSGITVNGVEPGNIMTDGLSAGRSAEYIAAMEESIPMGRLGTPRDVANAVLFLASDEAAYITGTTIVVDGGQTLPESKDFNTAS